MILFKLFQQLHNLFLPSHALSLSLSLSLCVCAALLVRQNGPQLGFDALSLSRSLFSLSFSSCAARDKFLLKKHILLFKIENFTQFSKLQPAFFSFFFPGYLQPKRYN